MTVAEQRLTTLDYLIQHFNGLLLMCPDHQPYINRLIALRQERAELAETIERQAARS